MPESDTRSGLWAGLGLRGCERAGLRAEVKHLIELLDESYSSEVP